MHLCRVAWQTLASRLTRAAPLLRGHGELVPFRQMSSGSVPGSSGENLIYYLLVAGAAGAGGYYAYRTVSSDKVRYNQRVEDIQQRTTAEWKPKPWPPQSLESDEMETNEAAEASEEAKPATEEETEAGESEVQNEKQTVPAEAETGEKSPTVEASSDVQAEKQDSPASSEAAQTKGTPDDVSDSKVVSPQENLEGTPAVAPASQEKPDTASLDEETGAD